MTKVVVNRCYGGFGLSDEAIHAVARRKGLTLYTKQYHGCTLFYTSPDYSDDSFFRDRSLDRTDPDLIAVVEEMGKSANGEFASLEVVEIPDDVEWFLDDYDGIETIREEHRT